MLRLWSFLFTECKPPLLTTFQLDIPLIHSQIPRHTHTHTHILMMWIKLAEKKKWRVSSEEWGKVWTQQRNLRGFIDLTGAADEFCLFSPGAKCDIFQVGSILSTNTKTKRSRCVCFPVLNGDKWALNVSKPQMFVLSYFSPPRARWDPEDHLAPLDHLWVLPALHMQPITEAHLCTRSPLTGSWVLEF